MVEQRVVTPRIARPRVVTPAPGAGSASAAGACRTRPRGCVGTSPSVLIDMRNYVQQGFLGGQRESDTAQWHGEGRMLVLRCRDDGCDDSCTSAPSLPLVGGFFHKQYRLDRSGAWLCPDGAAPSVHNMKTRNGAPIEYACTDDENVLLLWETSPFIDCRFDPLGNPRAFLREAGGGVEEGALWTRVLARSGEFVKHGIRETRFQCGDDGSLTESSRGSSRSWFQILGPYDISTPESRARVLAFWRRSFMVPSELSDEENLPREWYEGFPARIGRPGAKVEVVIRRDYLNIRNDDFRTRNFVEHYFYGSIDRGGEAQFGTGLIRWNFASLADQAFFQQGTVTRLVEEPAGRLLLGRDLCEQ